MLKDFIAKETDVTKGTVYIYQAFSQLKITAPRSLVPVSASRFISCMIFSTRMPSVMMASR